MTYEFALPDVGEGVAEGEILAWLVDVGETVEEDQPVAEVETDKAVVDIPSPVAGTVVEHRYEEGDIVPVGETFVVIDTNGNAELEQEEKTDTQKDEHVETNAGETEEQPKTDVSEQRGRVFAPPRVRRLARELDVDLTRIDGNGSNGRITESDVRATAEKTVSADETTSTGGTADDTHPNGTTASDTTPTEAPATQVAENEHKTLEVAKKPAERDRTLARPSTRLLAAELEVDINAVPADTTYEGHPFVTEDAVRSFAQRKEPATDQTAAGKRSAVSADTGTTVAVEERIPYRGVRRSIGERMEQSKYTIPHATYVDEADVTELVRVRARLNEHADVPVTYMPFIIKACIAGLEAQPEMNSELDEQAEEIVLKGEYHIGVATETERGLLVPVLEDADEKSIRDLAIELDSLVTAAREGNVTPDQLQGSTFTITNFGAIGGQYGTPIINYPEASILGCGTIVDRPRVVDKGETDSGRDSDMFAGKEIVPRKIMGLSVSVDHRLVDGAIAAEFTNHVKEFLENPMLLLTK